MIAIIDYDAGNLTSVKRALDSLGVPSVVTADADAVRNAERIILPGVGHAGTAVRILRQRGLDKALREAFATGKPIMGICLGAQIILSRSEEGNTECLGLIDGTCPRFSLTNPALKVPHMGWNAVTIKHNHFVLKDVQPGDEFYFVHSYYPLPDEPVRVLATSEYEVTFPVAVGSRSLVATQFHPEKSGRIGLQILRNFTMWDGAPC